MSNQVNSITVLGCGLMGSAIAKQLASTGTPVTAWNRSPAAAEKLSAFGIKPEKSLEQAVIASDCIVVVISDYDACKSLLAPLLPVLQGKVIVNLTSGTYETAKDLGDEILQAGVEYLDGSIWTVPGSIGDKDTCVAFAGSERSWDRSKKQLMALGGASRYVGPDIGAANVLEAAFPGTFFMTSLLSFIEGVAVCKAYGVPEHVVEQAIEPTLVLLRDSLVDSLKKISTGDFATDQTTQQVLLGAASGYAGNARSPVKQSHLTKALLQTLDDSIQSGRAQEDVASTIRKWIEG